MAVAHIQDNAFAGLLRPIAHAHQFQGLGIALGDADDGIGNQAAGQAVQGMVKLPLREPFHQHHPILHLDFHLRVVGLGQDAARPGDRYAAIVDLHRHPFRDGDGFAADPGPGAPFRFLAGIRATRHNRAVLLQCRVARLAGRSSPPAAWTEWQCPSRRTPGEFPPCPHRAAGPAC